MKSHRALVFTSVLTILLSACSSSPTGPTDLSTTETVGLDVDPPDDASAVPASWPAADYCERSMEMFCSFYLRCGRMAVEDLAACRSAFAEACNAKYEPYYVDLESRDLLSLSPSGLAACAERLESVACEAQVFDLDECDAVWTGHVSVGGKCGPGLESFVCEEDAVCVLDTSFCGACFKRADDGQACDESTRCGDKSTCVEGTCTRRPRGGEPCPVDGTLRCVVGTSCTDGRCLAPTPGSLGASCGDDGDCRYRSSCIGGVCTATAFLGEPCGAQNGCASGYCGSGTCRAFLPAGEACDNSRACQSGRCVEGQCAPFAWNCVGR